MVEDGESSVDESFVTGESIPVDKAAGDEVIGGSLNLLGTLVVRVTRVGEESFLQQVARHIEEARALKPGIIQLVDKILLYYVPGVLLFALLGISLWTLGALVFLGKIDLIRGVYAALAALVMGYPCALGMATPLAMIRGGGLAAENGILMRSAEAFQIFKDVKIVVLDKTGTITKGEPEVVDILSFGEFDPTMMLRLAASAENPSEHPLARAIVGHAGKAGISLFEIQSFEVLPGSGVRAEVNDKKIIAGSLRFVEGEGITSKRGSEIARMLEDQGKTIVAVAVDGKLIGIIAIADTLKEDSKDAIREMKKAGLKPVMITGDNRRTAQAVAQLVGIEEVMAEVMPDEKAAQVRALQAEGHRVAMVGDGINDAPALMQADVGIAIGAGTDIAIESADIILVGNRLSAVMDAYNISRKAYQKTVQNLILAFSFNGVGVTAAISGLVHPVWAMIAMAASVSAVLLNSFGGQFLTKKKPMIGRETFDFYVPNMHCEGCIENIETALKRKMGDIEVRANLEKHLLSVTTQGMDVSEGEIKQALIEIGFKPRK